MERGVALGYTGVRCGIRVHWSEVWDKGTLERGVGLGYTGVRCGTNV